MSRKGGAFTLVGISSFGSPCENHQAAAVDDDNYLDYDEAAAPSTPSTSGSTMLGVYTNVSNYVDWIMQNSDYTGCKRRRFPLHRILRILT